MAKNIWVYARNGFQDSLDTKIQFICKRLSPDHLQNQKIHTWQEGNVAYGIVGYNTSVLCKDASVLLGKMYGTTEDWHKPQAIVPDGSFALFRNSQSHVELITDCVGSRSIWYYKDNEKFVASTSQRAIIMYLGTLEPNTAVYPWILSSGTPGPKQSWDRRITLLPPDSMVRLDKENWELHKVISQSVQFRASKKTSDTQHGKNLKDSLNQVFKDIDLNDEGWVLPLSGGYDSRSILLFLGRNINKDKIKTITWGAKGSEKNTEGDAYIAKAVAQSIGVKNTFYETNTTNDDLSIVFQRFLELGEGRIDHISGYLDGFNTWKTLHDSGVKGIIRGDEGFGWVKTHSKLTTRHAIGLNLMKDYANLVKFTVDDKFNNTLPSELDKKENETIADWRDRLYHEFRIPTVLAALSDLKLAYIEIMNPLLSKRIISRIRNQPESFRTNKTLFKTLVDQMNIEVPFAKKDGNISREERFGQADAKAIFIRALTSPEASSIFPEQMISDVLTGLKREVDSVTPKRKKNKSFKHKIKALIPSWLKSKIKDKVQITQLDNNILAFRMYTIISMLQILQEDSNAYQASGMDTHLPSNP